MFLLFQAGILDQVPAVSFMGLRQTRRLVFWLNIDADEIGWVRVIVGNYVTKVLPKLHPQKIFTAGSPG